MNDTELLLYNAPPILVSLARRWHAQGRSFYLGPENLFWYGIQRMTWTAPLAISQEPLSWRICTSDYLSPNYQMTAQDFTDLAEIFSSNAEYTVCGIDTSPACNLRCHMCCYHTVDPFFDRHPQLRINIDINTLYKRLENIATLGIRNLAINASGEFLTYRYWREELAYARKLGMTIVSISSNGTLLTEENCRFIAAQDVKSVLVSLHAVTFETFKSFTGAGNPALFETAVAGIKYLKKLGVHVVARTTWCDVNSSEIEAFIKYWNDLGIDAEIVYEINFNGDRMNRTVDVPFGWCHLLNPSLIHVMLDGRMVPCAGAIYFVETDGFDIPTLMADANIKDNLQALRLDFYRNPAWKKVCGHCQFNDIAKSLAVNAPPPPSAGSMNPNRGCQTLFFSASTLLDKRQTNTKSDSFTDKIVHYKPAEGQQIFMHSTKKLIKAVLKPVFRTYMNRMRTMVREELAQALPTPMLAPAVESSSSAGKQAVPYQIDPYFFSELSPERKRLLFAYNVQHFLLETHSYCNRKCWFCPNVHLDRHSTNKYMDDNLYRKIIYEIAEIDTIYKGTLHLACYNEPLADDAFSEKVRQAKILLPNIKIHINTNGDYLTPEILHRLHSAGLSRILVSVYIDSHEPGAFTYEKALQAVLGMNEKLKIDAAIITTPNDRECAAVARYGKTNTEPGMYVLIHSENHCLTTNYRGGAVPDTNPTPRCAKRELMCIAPFTQFNIYYDGQATICCDLRPDYPEHGQYISGNINHDTIFDVFSNKISTRFRKKLVYDLNSLQPCRHCVDNIEISPHHTLIEL